MKNYEKSCKPEHSTIISERLAMIGLMVLVLGLLCYIGFVNIKRADELAIKARRAKAERCLEVVRSGNSYEAVLIQSDYCLKEFGK